MRKVSDAVLDKMFSRLIRGRDNWTCQACKHQHEGSVERGAKGLDCSHLVGRRIKAVRWHPLNAVAHCTACHFRLGANPDIFDAWTLGYLGEKRYGDLHRFKKVIVEWTETDRRLLHAEMKVELERLKLSEHGGVEFLGFTLWTVEGVIELGKMKARRRADKVAGRRAGE